MPRGWLTVVGYEGLYEVSDDGQVRRTKSGRILKPETTPSSRYLRVSLSKENKVTRFNIHSLLLKAFRGPKPEGKVGRHLNDVPTDNSLDNLVWGTCSENYWDQHRNGTWRPRGKDLTKRDQPYFPRATLVGKKLTRNDINSMKILSKDGTTQKELAELFKINPSTVSRILSGTRWSE